MCGPVLSSVELKVMGVIIGFRLIITSSLHCCGANTDASPSPLFLAAGYSGG